LRQGYAGIHASKPELKQFFKDCALFFYISTGEESSQLTKNENKIIISIVYYGLFLPLYFMKLLEI